MRYTPVLDFKLDDSLEYSRKIDDIFKKINKGKA
jgi:ribosome-binding factor A